MPNNQFFCSYYYFHRRQQQERNVILFQNRFKALVVYLFTISRCVSSRTRHAGLKWMTVELDVRDCFSLKTDLLWKAPELLNDSSGQIRGSQKADVYAFGFILFEILTRQEAFGAYKLEPKGLVF